MTRFFIGVAIFLAIVFGLVLYVAASPLRAIAASIENVTQNSVVSDK